MIKKIPEKINIKKLIDSLYKQVELKQLIEKIIIHYPKFYLVGGAVRDFFLQRPLKDYDFVVEGVDKDELFNFLSELPGKLVDIQSRNFGVFKYRLPKSKMVIDIALPRLDIYQQYFLGHQDVKTVSRKNLTIFDDLSRRDFTINSLAVDLSTRKLIDPFNGLEDLGLDNSVGQIRAVGNPYDRLVKEDPTRMMRALRFACQLNFPIETETYQVIKTHHDQIQAIYPISQKDHNKTLTRVAKEVLAAEFLKGFSANSVQMIELLDNTGVYQTILTSNLVTCWNGMKTTDQPPDFHAEGSVWNHTILALKNISKLSSNNIGLPPAVSINVQLAVFLHDFGKVATFIRQDDKYTYYNHPEVSAELSREFIKHLRLNSPFAKKDKLYVDQKKVEFLVKKHMLPFNVKAEEIKERKIIKYFLEDEVLGTELLQVSYVDASSALKSGHKPPNYHSIQQFIKRINIVKQKLVTPLNESEINLLKLELTKLIATKLFSQKQLKLLLAKISNNQILDQTDLDLINKIILELTTDSNQKTAIVNCRDILTKIVSKKTPYPVSGDLIKQLITNSWSRIKKQISSPEILSEIETTISNPSGGRIIGDLKEMFLLDRLNNPNIYFSPESKILHSQFKKYLTQKIIDYYLKNL